MSRPRSLPFALLIALIAVPAAHGGAADPPWFVDIAAEAGVDFRYDNGMTGEYWFPEIMGGGVALLDYDGDGLLDVYLVQGGALGPDDSPDAPLPGDRLFRNDSQRDVEGRWQWRFTDVTASAGIVATGYGMGVAVGDYNGDGHTDLYVLNFGDNQLWRNDGDGTFTDVTEAAGVNDARWSVSASFADLDGDGWLDLVVVNYADYHLDKHKACRSAGTNLPDYCSPSAYSGVADSVFRNLGDGRFEDASAVSGLAGVKRHGLGVVVADLDDDGQPDIYVANDGDPNSLWINQGGMRFVDDAFLAGAAVNVDGKTEAGMGVDAADYNRSGREDLFVTHMRSETNTLYRNEGEGWFSDVTAAAGLAVPSLGFTGFGVAWMDIDNDGWQDLVVANGAVFAEQDQVAAGRAFPYLQSNQAFKNMQDGSFREVSSEAGPAFEKLLVSRGTATGDLDNDGDADVVFSHIDGPAQLLINRAAEGRRWLGLRLVDAAGRRELPGSTAWLLEDGRPGDLRRSHTDGSYASANDPRVIFGLLDQAAPRDVRIHWADGLVEDFAALSVDRYHTLRRGSGKAVTAK